MSGSAAPAILAREDGATIAYHRTPGRTPGVILLGGFMSDMTGSKATALEAFCRARGQAFVRFDYFAHGASSGDFAEATIGRWRDDALGVIDALTEGPQVLVGSSIGGWVMLLAARERPERIKGLVGVAAAPDATEDLMWAQFPKPAQAALMSDGQIRVPSEYSEQGYLITRKLIEDGRRNLVLRAPLPIACPVRLLHGMEDKDVPWELSLRLAGHLASTDVTVTLVKHGDHRLSTDVDLARLCATVESLL
jgi:pimeloyl-ACP methyl ester carboxylesterase